MFFGRNVTVSRKYERDHDENGEGYGYLASQVYFAAYVSLADHGSGVTNLSCITSIVRVSRLDAMTGAVSVVGESKSKEKHAMIYTAVRTVSVSFFFSTLQVRTTGWFPRTHKLSALTASLIVNWKQR